MLHEMSNFLGLLFIGDGVANLVWWHFHRQKYHKWFQLGRLARAILGGILVVFV